MSYTAKAAQHKKDEAAALTKLMQDHPIIGILNVENLGAAPLAVLRGKLRKDVTIRMSKKQLIKRAIDGLNDRKDVGKLKDSIVGMPALLLTKENPFKVAKLIKESKSKAPAKPGQTAPYDIVIPAGPTQFTPGPIISELGKAGLKTGVEDGKIVIKEDKVVAGQGDTIDQPLSELLAKFDIQPMEIGLDLVAAYEDGTIYGKDVLSVDPAEYVDMLRSAAAQSFNLSLEIAYPSKENVERLVGRAFSTAKNLALDKGLISDVWAEKQVEDAERAAMLIAGQAGFDPEAAPKPESKGDSGAKDESAGKKEEGKPAEEKKEKPSKPESRDAKKEEPQKKPEAKKEPEKKPAEEKKEDGGKTENEEKT